MNTYRLHIVATVMAESESAARQCFIDDDFDDVSLVSVEEDDACPDDPDGVHHVGCGCDYRSRDDP